MRANFHHFGVEKHCHQFTLAIWNFLKDMYLERKIASQVVVAETQYSSGLLVLLACTGTVYFNKHCKVCCLAGFTVSSHAKLQFSH